MRILVVDTDVGHLVQLTMLLKAVYPESEIAPFDNPMLAVQYGINHEIDIIFTEIRMRGVDGFNLVRLIRRHNERTAVYFVSDGYEDMSSAVMENVEGYLKKPVTEEVLKAWGIQA